MSEVRASLSGGYLLNMLAYSLFDSDESMVSNIDYLEDLNRRDSIRISGLSFNIKELAKKSLEDRIMYIMRDIIVETVTKGKWRANLSSSMKLANILLDDIASGLSQVYEANSSIGVVIDTNMALIDRGLTGTGSGLLKAMLEVGLNIDWLLGLPYYPGSTLKGAARAVLEDVDPGLAGLLFGSSSGSDSSSHSKDSESGAGYDAHVGYMFVSDAYPVGCYRGSGHPCLVYTGDVVTPHYFRPRSGIVEKEYEAQPTPIVHVAVAPGTVFRVVVGVRKAPDEHLNRLLRAGRELGFLRDNEARGVYGLGLFIARLLGAAMMAGFAARSGKGYNVFKPLSDDEVKNLSFEIVSLGIRQSRARPRGHEYRGRRQPGGRSGERGRGRGGSMPRRL